MILHRHKNIELIEVVRTHSDVLIVRCKVYNISFKVMLIYMSVNDIELNRKLLQHIQNNIDIKLYSTRRLQWTYMPSRITRYE